MSAIVFSTPGLIDLRAFTVMGFNAKPTKPNPIGFFGTGLKYAIAVLCRMGARPIVYIGRDKYTFFTKQVDFRGKAFDQVWMRAEKFQWTRPRNMQLPFTTEYGKNWQPWMVYRELESNTRDEGGETLEIAHQLDGNVFKTVVEMLLYDSTLIVVDGDYLIMPHAERGQLFIDDETHPWVAKDERVVVRQNANDRLFYRGVRAKNTGKPTLYTYDFQNTHGLTEDRTFEHEYHVRADLGTFVAICNDEAVIEAIITAAENKWEHNLEIPSYTTPSDAFRAVMARHPRGVNSTASSYYGRHHEAPEKLEVSPWKTAKRPWRVQYDNTVVDSDDNELFREPAGYEGVWARLAEELVRVGNTILEAPKEWDDEDSASDIIATDNPDKLHLTAVVVDHSDDEEPFNGRFHT